MDLHLVFLGTAGATPTVDRGSPATLIARGGERILVDCGEGTQRQLMRSVGLARINTILLTHLHGDHYLGLAGSAEDAESGRQRGAAAALRARRPLRAAPGGGEDHRAAAIPVPRRGGASRVPFYEMPDYATEDRPYRARPARVWPGVWRRRSRLGIFHPERAVELGVTPGPDFGRLQRGETITHRRRADPSSPDEVMDEARPGRKIVITGDTRPTEAIIQLAAGASVLVHDSTFAESEKERALETGHSTAREAAEVARAAGVETLVLTHIELPSQLARAARRSPTGIPRRAASARPRRSGRTVSRQGHGPARTGIMARRRRR